MLQTVKEYAKGRGCSARTVYEASYHRKFKIEDSRLDPAEADKVWPAGESASVDAKPRFAQQVIAWIQRRGVTKTATEIGVQPRSVWKYIQGSMAPRPEHAQAMIALAKAEGHEFALEDFYKLTTPTKRKAK